MNKKGSQAGNTRFFVVSFFRMLASLKLMVVGLFALKQMIDFVSLCPCCPLLSPPPL